MTISETREKASYPGLMHAAVSVMDAVQNLSNTAQTMASESNDEVIYQAVEYFKLQLILLLKYTP